MLINLFKRAILLSKHFNKEDFCSIDGVNRIDEKHHIYPINLGGPKEGPLINLCSNCHNDIHRLAREKKKDGLTKNIPNATPTGLAVANALMDLIIQADLAVEKDTIPDSQVRKMTLEVSHEALDKMHRRKKDLGFTNMHDYLINLIENDLRNI